jgi:DegV family protein with EDD domain
MIRIISDTSTLYSVSEGEKNGIYISPLSVTINNKTYEEFEEIQNEEFVDIIHQGHIPLSSQPAIGRVVDMYNRFPEDELLNITMADGLSGTYNSAVMAKDMAEHSERITVLNSKTLCGPHRTLVDHAKHMADHHASLAQILNKLEQMIESSKSFLIPQDFDYLKRGGRLSHFAAFVGKAIHLVPVMTMTKDRKQLCNFTIKRSFKKAIQEIIEHFHQDNLGNQHKLFVSHSIAPALAETAKAMLKEAFPHTEVSILHLSPAFTTQGGPGCVAIQSICME